MKGNDQVKFNKFFIIYFIQSSTFEHAYYLIFLSVKSKNFKTKIKFICLLIKLIALDSLLNKIFQFLFHILGEHGKLEEAELIMIEVEKVRSRKEDLIKIAESQNLNAKSMKVHILLVGL